MIFSRLIFLLFFFSTAGKLAAQGGGSIKVTIDKNRILIGEPILLTVDIRLPGTTPVASFNLDSITHFEILEPAVVDTITKNNETFIKVHCTITSFDSGHWVIPSYHFSDAMRSDSLPVDVVFSDFNPNQEYHDIKDIIEVIPKKKTPWWWYAAGGGLLILTGVVIYLLQKKKPATIIKTSAPSISINAYEEAMKELHELQRSKPDAKTFHSKLTGIFRLYVYRKKGILSLQKTTDDLVLQLNALNMDKDQFDKLALALRLGDFVKFAKYIPSNDDDATAFDTIKNSIVNIEKSEAQVLPAGRI